LAGEAYRGAAHREQSPPGFGYAELGALAGNPDVGALQNLRTARDRGTFDRGDERFGESAALQQPVDAAGVERSGFERLRRAVGGHVLQIRTRAERTA